MQLTIGAAETIVTRMKTHSYIKSLVRSRDCSAYQWAYHRLSKQIYSFVASLARVEGIRA